MPLHRLALLTLVLLAAACSPAGDTDRASADIVDDLGHAFTPDRVPERVVSLVPSVTDLVVALGADHRLVARTRYDTDPRLAHLPSVGGGLDPNIEAVIALRPDLVVAWPTPDQPLVRQLEAVGISVYGAGSQSMEDIARHTAQLGRLLGARPAADSLLAVLDEGFATLAQRLGGVSPRSALYVAWHDPPMTSGPGTFVDSIIRAAGGSNVFADVAGDWPQVSLEEVVRRDPDVLIIPVANPSDSLAAAWVYDLTGWRTLRAVRTGGVLLVESDLFGRPGPRVLEAATELARRLHPEVFEGEVP